MSNKAGLYLNTPAPIEEEDTCPNPNNCCECGTCDCTTEDKEEA